MVLITGGAGYIGSHTIVELLNNNFEVVVVDNFANSHPKAIERVKEITGKDFPFYELDVCNEADINEVFVKHKIDSVIHFAGLKAVGESVSVPLTYYQNNIDSTITLLKVMKNHNVKTMIFSSSATVYRADNPMPLVEDANLGCTNPYGWTKYMNEQIITDTVKASEGLSAVLLRYFNPIGAHESGLIGEDPSGIPNNLMPFITQTAAGIHKELSVWGDDYDTADGTCIRDYIHVCDLAAGHVAALNFCGKTKGGLADGQTAAINLGTGQGTSVLEAVKIFTETTGAKVPFAIKNRRAGDNATSFANPTKAAELLNWRTKKSFADACRDMWKWQQKNPNGYN